tara:strand:+ start:49 stop:774 length:726 start_codon:yes stop_codon:yes gene_type:complete
MVRSSELYTISYARSAAPFFSLSPSRRDATSCAEICALLLTEDETDTILGRSFAQGIRAVEENLRAHFPNNIYADLDYLAQSLLQEARAQTNPSTYLEASFSLTADLFQLYGCHSPIHFRYAHDFLYGFDWVRWVQKMPTQRRNTGPFDQFFLHYLKGRANELLSLIADDDATYPRLETNRDRNPFLFSRGPSDETRLHQSLADDGLIPVKAWCTQSVPQCAYDYSALREERAQQLRIDYG